MAKAPYIKWESEWAGIKKLLDSGHSAPAVEKITGIKATSINAYCSRIGYKISRLNKDKIKNDEHDINLMLVLRHEGFTHQQIADKFDCSYGEVSRLTGKRYKLLKLLLLGKSAQAIADSYGMDVSDVHNATSAVLEMIRGNNGELRA